MTSADEQVKQVMTQPEPEEARFAYAAGWVVLGLVLLGAVMAGWVQGPGLAILVLAAGALIAAIVMFWSSLRSLSGETVFTTEEALSVAAPVAEEEQKRAVIRSLEDIETDHGAGKISDEDYAALSEQLRAEAKRLLRLLDERDLPERREAERLVAAELQAGGLAVPDSEPERQPAAERPPAAQPKKGKGKKKKKERRRQAAGAAAAAQPALLICEQCDTQNDPDALFCKRCGQSFGARDEEERP